MLTFVCEKKQRCNLYFTLALGQRVSEKKYKGFDCNAFQLKKQMVLINGHLKTKNNAIYSVFYKLISTTDLALLDFIGV